MCILYIPYSSWIDLTKQLWLFCFKFTFWIFGSVSLNDIFWKPYYCRFSSIFFLNYTVLIKKEWSFKWVPISSSRCKFYFKDRFFQPNNLSRLSSVIIWLRGSKTPSKALVYNLGTWSIVTYETVFHHDFVCPLKCISKISYGFLS